MKLKHGLNAFYAIQPVYSTASGTRMGHLDFSLALKEITVSISISNVKWSKSICMAPYYKEPYL